MDETLVREVARQVISQEILANWKFYLLLGALSLLGSVAANLVAPYVRKLQVYR
jgi:hypothetical protein